MFILRCLMFFVLLRLVTFYNLNLQIDYLGYIENIIGCSVLQHYSVL